MKDSRVKYFILFIKKHPLLNLFFVLGVCFVSVFIVFFILPLEYSAQSSFYVAKTPSSMRLLGVTSSSGKSALSLLSGDLSEDTYSVTRILQSNSMKLHFIKKYNLLERWGIPDTTTAFLRWKNYINYDINDDESISLDVIDTSKVFTANLNEEIVIYIDSQLVNLNTLESKIFIDYFDTYLNKKKSDLEAAEKKLFEFQRREKYSEPITEAKLSASFLERQFENDFVSNAEIVKLSSSLGENHPKVVELKRLKDKLSLELDSLKNIYGLNYKAKLIDKSQAFVLMQREVKIASEVLQILYPIIEEIKLKSTMDVKRLIVFDKPIIPDHHVKPKRLFLTAGIVFGVLMIYVTIISFVLPFGRGNEN